jgi:hypothetical protein
MAVKINSIAQADVPMLSKTAFLASAEHGFYLLCSGNNIAEKAVELGSGSCFSHIARIWDGSINEGLTLESTPTKGVHVGTLRHYVEHYDGDLLLARRLCMTRQQTSRALYAGAQFLDDPYDMSGIFKTAFDRLLRRPAQLDYKRQYCSELMFLMDAATDFPLQYWETPGQQISDSTFVYVCAKLKEAQ